MSSDASDTNYFLREFFYVSQKNVLTFYEITRKQQMYKEATKSILLQTVKYMYQNAPYMDDISKYHIINSLILYVFAELKMHMCKNTIEKLLPTPVVNFIDHVEDKKTTNFEDIDPIFDVIFSRTWPQEIYAEDYWTLFFKDFDFRSAKTKIQNQYHMLSNQKGAEYNYDVEASLITCVKQIFPDVETVISDEFSYEFTSDDVCERES